MMNRTIRMAALVLLVTAGGLAQDVYAANSRDKLPKAKPAAEEAKAKPQPKPEKPAASTDDFKDRDNNGVDDRHEKRAIRPEPTTSPTVKQDAQPKTTEAAKPAEPQVAPPAGKPNEPPPKAPPRF